MNIPKIESSDYTLIVAVALVIAIGFGSIYGTNHGWFDWTVTRNECPYGETIVVINGQLTCVPK